VAALVSHFAASVVGSLLLVVGYGLLRRLRIAWIAALALLLNGALIAWLRVDTWWVWAAFVLVAALLASVGRAFYRDARLVAEPLTAETLVALVAVAGCAITLALVAYGGRVAGESWWSVVLSPLAPDSLRFTAASKGYVAQEVARQRAEIERRRERFRQGRPLSLPDGATAILVDDGVATGSTAIAAIHALRAQQVARLVFAIPVAPPDTAERLRGMVDELVVLATPELFAAVGGFYVDFEQVSDDEVVDLLRRTAVEPRAEP
jgi:predicted phosphoribosyltransferase